MLHLWRFAVLVAALLVAAVLGQTNTSQSGCEVCAITGDCSKAYQGTPGKFCGNWLDQQNERRPCCCPDDAVCKVSNYACNCGYVGMAGRYPAGNDDGGLLWLWSLLGSLALLLCCCGCCFMAAKRVRDRQDQDSPIPVAAPVASPIPGGVGSQPYGATSTAYACDPPYQLGYATATPAYGQYHGQSRRGGGMGAGTGAALGGTAGLLGGLMLGGALADHGDSYDNGGDIGGFDSGGGDFGGDF
ncbi:unnamed protein product [Peronospora belbahrii]|uniref:Uncharacterized protein n=1 Tax=Peronospora belbahrii TaxID=622444 RepID=A0AAU9KZ64_9STRA|nr:unnamed protein product [Peronospora belbahrii]CAH0519032.1 unnamed protein product [Peronospora belbahrii]